MIFAVITFVVILLLIVAPYWLFVVRGEQGATKKLRKRMKVSASKGPARPELMQAETPLSHVAAVDSVLRKTGLITAPLHRKVLQSGLNITVGGVVLASLLIGFVVFVLMFWLTRWISVAAGLAAAATIIPYVIVKIAAGRRLRKFEEQFPEATELLARALRAGHAFTTGLQMVADELPEPVGAEFRLVYDRQAFGMPLADALRDMAQRVPLLDARFFVTAVLTQRESGGNLSEVLDNLAKLMRERFMVRREVRTLSAHGRITGWVLGLLAPVLAIILVLLAPQHMSLLITDSIGRFMIGVAVFLQIVGVFTIRRIIDIEI
jgi:tight adherence protein B